jgi:hypothetical protein
VNFVMFVFLFGLMGRETSGNLFPTLEACEAERAQVTLRIADHNASAEPNKVVFYSSVCHKVQRAPTGNSV